MISAWGEVVFLRAQRAPIRPDWPEWTDWADCADSTDRPETISYSFWPLLLLGQWTTGPLDRLDHWTDWTTGPLDHWTDWTDWTTGPLDHWTTGPLDDWTARSIVASRSKEPLVPSRKNMISLRPDPKRTPLRA